jgi:hypothetical protein
MAVTNAVTEHYRFSMAHPQDSLVQAIRASGAEIVIPCDDHAIRTMHIFHGETPATPAVADVVKTIERSLGDPAAYLLIGSRHEVQTAARAEGLNAAESFAIGRATNLETLMRQVPFPWVMKADHTWGGTGVRFVNSLAEAHQFIQHAGAPPGLAKAIKQLIVNGNRSAMGEWMRGMHSDLSMQRPVEGKPANTVAACWKGEVLATISVDVLATIGETGPATKVRIIENAQMLETVTHMARVLGLSGFHGFDFMLDESSGKASLIELNTRCAPPCHVNAGPGHDLVDAFVRRWLGKAPAAPYPAISGDIIAYFPHAWAADPNDPILDTAAHDIPKDEPRFVERMKQLAQRDLRYLALKRRVEGMLGKAGTRD